MDREEALRLLESGYQGIQEWNIHRRKEEVIPDLNGANLTGANLGAADLSAADLSGAKFMGAKLSGTDLRAADLIGADLRGANLTEAKLIGANLEEAMCHDTIFADLDLSQTRGLDKVVHEGPSSVGIDTIIKSQGKIPEAFLRGCGVPDVWITHIPSLIGGMQPIQFYSCFLSYSSKDEEFANRLHARMVQEKLRVWFAPEDLKIGDRFRIRIDESIRVYDKLLLVLSESSLASQEVENEVEAAMDREKRNGETMLFPVRLDDAVLHDVRGWPALVRRSRHIGDFTDWKDHDAFETAFARLIRDLKAEGPPVTKS
jgi:hypothetical protein